MTATAVGNDLKDVNVDADWTESQTAVDAASLLIAETQELYSQALKSCVEAPPYPKKNANSNVHKIGGGLEGH